MSSLDRVSTNLAVAASLVIESCPAKTEELSRLQQTTLELSKILEAVDETSSQASDSTVTIPTETALKIHEAALK